MDLIRKNTARTPEIDDKLKTYPLQLTPGTDIHRELSSLFRRLENVRIKLQGTTHFPYQLLLN